MKLDKHDYIVILAAIFIISSLLYIAYSREGDIVSWLNGLGFGLLIFWGYFQFRGRTKKKG